MKRTPYLSIPQSGSMSSKQALKKHCGCSFALIKSKGCIPSLVLLNDHSCLGSPQGLTQAEENEQNNVSSPEIAANLTLGRDL